MIHRSHSFGQVSALLRRHPPLECWELASHGPSPVWIWSNNSLKIRRTDYQEKLGSKSWLEHFQVPVEGLDSTWVFQVVSMIRCWTGTVESQAGTDGGPQKIIHGRVQTYFALETNATLIRDGSTWEYWDDPLYHWFSLVPVMQIRTCKHPPVGSNAAVSINSSIWKCFAYWTSFINWYILISFDTSSYFRWYLTSTLAHFSRSQNLKIPCAGWNPHLGCCLMKQGPQLSMRTWQRNHWELPDTVLLGIARLWHLTNLKSGQHDRYPIPKRCGVHKPDLGNGASGVSNTA